MNSIMVIHPYKDGEVWVFDDPAVGLYKEALIAGADDLCEFMTITKEEKKCTVIFSANPFPDHKFKLELQDFDENGHNYLMVKWNHKVWLCPALLKYFKEPPQNIYIDFK